MALWMHEAITWTKVDSFSGLSDLVIHLRAILQEMPKKSFCDLNECKNY